MTPILEDIYELFDHHIIVDAVKSSVPYLNKKLEWAPFSKNPERLKKQKMLHSKKSLYSSSSNSELFQMISSVAYFLRLWRLYTNVLIYYLYIKTLKKIVQRLGLRTIRCFVCTYPKNGKYTEETAPIIVSFYFNNFATFARKNWKVNWFGILRLKKTSRMNPIFVDVFTYQLWKIKIQKDQI